MRENREFSSAGEFQIISVTTFALKEVEKNSILCKSGVGMVISSHSVQCGKEANRSDFTVEQPSKSHLGQVIMANIN